MKKIVFAMLLVLLIRGAAASDRPLNFERVKVSDVPYEAATAFDVNKDGKMDIVCGEYWFAGPDFKKRHKICDVQKAGEYYDDFHDYPMDVNGDGYLDIVTGGWFGKMLRWRENPDGGTGRWKVHKIDQPGNIETSRFWDVDRDGYPDVVPNAGGKLTVYKLERDDEGNGTGKFKSFTVKESGVGHGIGFGDVNGDGRGDFVIPTGWVECPKGDPLRGKWAFHKAFNLGHASVPILVHDVNDDGLADLIVGEGHDYGLYWMEQVVKDGKRDWVKHMISKKESQYHDLQLHDLDKDGELELVTGKRYRAHNGKDPGGDDPVGTYYFEINGGEFKRFTLDFGPAEEHSGLGIYFWVADVDGNGWQDIVAPGKEGLYLFKNQGRK